MPMLRSAFMLTSVVACASHALTLALNSEFIAGRLSFSGKSKPLEHEMLEGYWTPASTKCDLSYNNTATGMAWVNASLHCQGFAPAQLEAEHDGSLHALPVFDDYDAAAMLSPLLSAVGTKNCFVPVGIVGELRMSSSHKPAVVWHST